MSCWHCNICQDIFHILTYFAYWHISHIDISVFWDLLIWHVTIFYQLHWHICHVDTVTYVQVTLIILTSITLSLKRNTHWHACNLDIFHTWHMTHWHIFHFYIYCQPVNFKSSSVIYWHISVILRSVNLTSFLPVTLKYLSCRHCHIYHSSIHHFDIYLTVT